VNRSTRGPVPVVLGVAALLALVVAAPVLVGRATAMPATPPPAAIAAPAGAGPAGHPVVVLGASISAGTGSTPEQAWPAVVGRCLGRRVVVGAVPGAGYVATGRGARGPVVRLLREADLARLDPSLVVLQAGHNDIGTPGPQLRAAVTTAVETAHRDAPRAPLALLTVVAHAGDPSTAARATDAAIVEAARRADPGVVVLDPLVEGWSFPRVADGLHPTATGQRLLAGHVLDDLTRAGVVGRGTCPNGAPAPS
jgi:lysophospholipase L1-like esterase